MLATRSGITSDPHEGGPGVPVLLSDGNLSPSHCDRDMWTLDGLLRRILTKVARVFRCN